MFNPMFLKIKVMGFSLSVCLGIFLVFEIGSCVYFIIVYFFFFLSFLQYLYGKLKHKCQKSIIIAHDSNLDMKIIKLELFPVPFKCLIVETLNTNFQVSKSYIK